MSILVESAVSTAKASPQSLLLSVNVDFDKSVVAQMVLFVILMVVLKPLLLDPMLRLFAIREQRTDGAKSEARKMQEDAASILARYEAEIAGAKAKANAERESLRRETAKMEAEVLAEAQKSADVITAEGRGRIAKEVETLGAALKAAEPALATQISTKILGREVRS
jgi:F-type H+-transporting ATPase subunit b